MMRKTPARIVDWRDRIGMTMTWPRGLLAKPKTIALETNDSIVPSESMGGMLELEAEVVLTTAVVGTCCPVLSLGI